MLLGMLLTYGIQPGPAIVTDHLDLMYLIVWSFAIACVAGAFLCFLATSGWPSSPRCPSPSSAPVCSWSCSSAPYQESGQLGDLWVMVALGVAGWLLKATGMPRAPFLIGFVLAIPMERYYYLTEAVYSPGEWLTRPWVLVFIAVLLGPAVLAAIRAVRARRNIDIDDAHHEPPGEDEGELTGSIWSLVTAAGSLVVFLAGFIVSSSFSPDARLVPRLLCGGGVLVAGWLLATEVRDRRRAGVGVRWTPDVGVALRTFGWMGAFLLLVTVGGYLAAMLVWVPAFLLFVSRARPRTVIAYTLAASVLVAVLPIAAARRSSRRPAHVRVMLTGLLTKEHIA